METGRRIPLNFIQIFPREEGYDKEAIKEGYVDKDFDDQAVEDIVNNPHIDRIQIMQYASHKTLRKVNEILIRRPDIQFRVSGQIHFPLPKGWDLSFLSLLPDTRRLSLDSFSCFDTDLTILKSLKKLNELCIYIYEVKDYSFIKDLTSEIEDLTIHAEMRSGRAKLDFKWLQHLTKLRKLSLGKIDGNLESISTHENLRDLTLRGMNKKNLSFLNQMKLESLTISWCNVDKIDWDTLQGITTLRSLTLFNIKKMDDISFVTKLPNLERLEMIWMGAIVRLPDMSALTNLKEVIIDTANRLEDISGLVGVKNLNTVKILISKSLTTEAAQILLSNRSIKRFICLTNKATIDFTKM